jgi:hypothetical protein
MQASKAHRERSLLNLILAWKQSPPKRIFDVQQHQELDRLKSILRLLAAARRLKRPEFDPFHYCGVIPLERYTRDFFAAMFGQEAPHGVAGQAFEAFLEHISSVNRSAIAPIRAVWDGHPPMVETEVMLDQARPDVLISTDKFLIAIEIKRRLGVETKVNGVSQGKRLQRSTFILAKKRNIPENCAVGIFLTPEGKPPLDSTLIPLKTKDLFRGIEVKLKSGRANGLTVNTKRMIGSYMDMLVGGTL